jgi:hypothetical protein
MVIDNWNVERIEMTRTAPETFLQLVTLNCKVVFVKLRNQNRVLAMAVQDDFCIWEVLINPEVYLRLVGRLDAVKHACTYTKFVYGHEVLFSELKFVYTGARHPALMVFIDKGIVGGGSR